MCVNSRICFHRSWFSTGFLSDLSQLCFCQLTSQFCRKADDGTFPVAGQGFTFRNAEFKVLEMDGLRVGRVMVEIKEVPTEEA